MPPIPKFPGLAKLISEAAPALAREGTESVAAKTAIEQSANVQKNILNIAEKVCAENPHMNCKLFVQQATGIPDFKKLPKTTLGQESVGDIYEFNNIGHYAINLGDGRVIDVPEWGATPEVKDLSSVMDEWNPPTNVYKTPSHIFNPIDKETSIAAKTMTKDEKAYLDMLRQQMAEREAFKSEFNLPVAHGTNLEKTGGKIIEEFIPSTSPEMTYGEGIYTGIIGPNKSSTSNSYTGGSKGGFNVPLMVRGNKIFNLYDRTLHDRFPHLKGIIPTVDESYQKLSNIHVGHPQLADALERIYKQDGIKGIEKYIRQYPEHFEGILAEPDTGIVKVFEPKNLRGQFAEYDPLKRKSGDYMSGLAGTGLIGASALSSNDAEAAPSFKGVKGLIKGVAPSLGKEAEEAAAREAFKSEFNVPVAHGTSSEKTGGKVIDEFIPSSTNAPHGEGIHTSGLDKNILYNENYRSNYFNTYAENQGGQVYPLQIRGKKVFNFDESQPSHIKNLIPSFGESFDKLAQLTGKSADELEGLSRREIEQLIKQYPEHFESLSFNKQFKTFEPKNVRSPFAKFDPAKKESGDILAGIAGATGLGAAAMSSSEAKAQPISASKESTPDVQIFRKKSNDQVMKEDLQKTKAELMQAYLDMNAAYANTPVDQRFAYPGAAENLRGYGAGGAEEPAISPIDFITPGMITAPAKALGKGVAALGREAIEAAPRILSNKGGGFGTPKGYVTDVLPAIKEAAQIKGFLPEAEAIETKKFKNIRALLPDISSSSTIKELPESIQNSGISLQNIIDGLKEKFPNVASVVANQSGSVGGKLPSFREVMPGMYSKAEAIIESKMANKATPQQILGILREAKPEEIEYLKIPKFLEGKDKVTKDEMLEYIRSNLPDIKALPVKGQIDAETRQKIALANKQRNILSAEWRSLDEERQKLSSELMNNSGLKGMNQRQAIAGALMNKDLEYIQTLNESGEISDKALNLFIKLLDNDFKSQLRSHDIMDIDNQVRSYKQDILPTKFNREDLVLPKGEHYEEHLFSYTPKSIQKDIFNLSEEGVKIYEDYENQISNLFKDAFAMQERVHSEVKQLEAPLSEKFQIAKQKLEEATLYNNQKNEKFLEQVNSLFPDDPITKDFIKYLIRDLRPTSLKYLHKDMSPDLLKIFEKTLGSDPDYISNLSKIKQYRDELSDIDEQFYQIRQTKEKELIQPILDKIDNLKTERQIALGPHNRTSFYGSHWDEPDILAHTRVNERIGENGEKHLFAEELQSDWHQKIRDTKRKLEQAREELPSEIAEMGGSNSEIRNLEQDLAELPKALMEKTWPEFLSKQLLLEAARKNVDNISWTTGLQQSDRYNLTKTFSQLVYNPDTQTLIAYGKKGGQIINESNISPQKLQDYIGKELTSKLLKTPKQEGVFGQQENVHSLIGDDLKVESKGMKGFYDEVIPNIMAKIGKRFGVKPEKTILPEAGEVWTMKLTPEMKKSIIKEKFPLFMKAGLTFDQIRRTLNKKSTDKDEL